MATILAPIDLLQAKNPWPVAQACLGKLPLRIWNCQPASMPSSPSGEAGHIHIENKRLFVHCGQGTLEIKKVQAPGGKVLGATDFLNGHDINADRFATS